MTEKEKLVLLLISIETSLSGIFSLVRIFDSADFPSGCKIGHPLAVLLEKRFIVVDKLNASGTPNTYKITERGREYVDTQIDGEELLGYITTMNNPAFLYKITKLILDKRKEKSGTGINNNNID